MAWNYWRVLASRFEPIIAGTKQPILKAILTAPVANTFSHVNAARTYLEDLGRRYDGLGAQSKSLIAVATAQQCYGMRSSSILMLGLVHLGALGGYGVRPHCSTPLATRPQGAPRRAAAPASLGSNLYASVSIDRLKF